MRRHAPVVLAAVLAACTGCGGGQGRTASATSSATTPPPPTQTALRPTVDPQQKPAETAPDTMPGLAQEPAPAPVAKKRKKGEPEVAQPAAPRPVVAPPLPDLVTLATTREQLHAAALIAAREEVELGHTNGANVAQRQAYIYSVWLPLAQERQAALAAVQDTRNARAQHQIALGGEQARQEARLAAVEAEWGPKVDAERAKTASVLSQ